jgi:hypothetical protein
VRGEKVQRFVTQYLLSHLEDFRADGKLLYRVPVGNVLQAFVFDSSGFSAERFYPHVFVQPLYMLSDHLTLTVGMRFRGSWKFHPEQEQQLSQKLLNEIFKNGLPFLRRHTGPEGIVAEVRKNPAFGVNPRLGQAVAYSLLILGRNDEGLDQLDRVLSILGRSKEPAPWARDLHAEIGTLREQLMRNPAEVRATLERWAEETRSNLGLRA